MPFLYENIVRPLLFGMPAETAHGLGMAAMRAGLAVPGAGRVARGFRPLPAGPVIRRFGLEFRNPVGVAAGFDKNASVVNGLASLGFGFVEVGTVTLRPQSGNPRPRMFRLPADEAIINRLGFNNEGAERVARRLASLRRTCVVGVNIGKNKDVPNEEALENYLATLDLVHAHADYLTVNVSSPNTPELRKLQRPESLASLLRGLMDRNRHLGAKPLLVKIAPDLTGEEISALGEVALDAGIAGIVATNTTVSRDGLTDDPGETGGLSGRPLRARSTAVIHGLFERTGGAIPIIGVGGVFSAEDAFEKVAAGACLLQCYTGLVYKGPSLASTLCKELTQLLEKKGFNSLDEAVGSGHRA